MPFTHARESHPSRANCYLGSMWGRRKYVALAGALGAAALLAAGCGGDDSAPVTTIQGATNGQGPTALSKT